MNEEWKLIEGTSKYYVSNFGNVKCNDYRHTGNEHLLTPNNNRYGKILIYYNDGRKSKSVHRLVAEAFIPNPDNLPCINHKDENKSNNHIDNLEWCTVKYNNNYGTARQRANESNKESITITKDGVNKQFDSKTECAIFLNVGLSRVSSLIKGYHKDKKRKNGIHKVNNIKGWKLLKD